VQPGILDGKGCPGCEHLQASEVVGSESPASSGDMGMEEPITIRAVHLPFPRDESHNQMMTPIFD
jgi:hypothetical protein